MFYQMATQLVFEEMETYQLYYIAWLRKVFQNMK